MNRYRVTYYYVSPGSAGPFKGKDVLDWKPSKGDQIRALFGLAIVKTVSKVKSEGI